MTARLALNVLAVVLLSITLALGDAVAQSSRTLVGTWTLVSADGFGQSPKGSLMFDDDGHFSAIFLRADLPNYASNNRSLGTADEYRAIANGSIAVFGTYTLDGTDLNLHIDGSTFPNWIGANRKRSNVTISTNEMRYTQPTPSTGGPPAVIVWRRASLALTAR